MLGESKHSEPQQNVLFIVGRSTRGYRRYRRAAAEFVSPEVCFHSLSEPARLPYQLEPLLYAKLRAFKSTHDTVGVPSRDQQVVDDAMANATSFHSPQKIATAVFTAIINTNVPFELCVVSAPGFYLCYAFSEYVPV